MREQLISKVYAHSLMELSEVHGIDIASELTDLTTVINENNHLETLLFLDVFTTDEKVGVLNEVLNRLNLSQMLKNFCNFLLQEKRIGIFPMVFKEVIVLDDEKKGFLRGTIEGSDDSISEKIKERIVEYLKKEIGKETLLDYIKNDAVSAGYKVTVGDLQLDASLDNQLRIFKKMVLES